MGLNLANTQQKIDSLIYNISETDRVLNDMYFGDKPKDVSFNKYDENGEMKTVTMPNMAKLKAEMKTIINIARNNMQRKAYVHKDTTVRTFGQGWAAGAETPFYEFPKSSLLSVSINVPMRNDNGGWGGGYTMLDWNINDKAWQSFGHSGYDGPMASGGDIIVCYNRTFLLNPQQNNNYKVKFRLQHRSYDGTLNVNGSHDISGEDFFTTIIVTEV